MATGEGYLLNVVYYAALVHTDQGHLHQLASKIILQMETIAQVFRSQRPLPADGGLCTVHYLTSLNYVTRKRAHAPVGI